MSTMAKMDDVTSAQLKWLTSDRLMYHAYVIALPDIQSNSVVLFFMFENSQVNNIALADMHLNAIFFLCASQRPIKLKGNEDLVH